MSRSELVFARIVADLAEGRWEEARRDFNAKMSEALDASRLAEAWARMASLVGSYEGMGEPFAHRVADHGVVEIPLRFEAGQPTGRVVFDEDGKVEKAYYGVKATGHVARLRKDLGI